LSPKAIPLTESPLKLVKISTLPLNFKMAPPPISQP
jgi:hypothetical protein